MAAVAPLLVAAVLAVTSCGANKATPGEPPATTTTTIAADSALTAAAAAVQPVLERSFPDTFAGLELRHDVPMLLVYRKPDPRLDAEVSRAAPGVRVEFRDARYTLVEMQDAAARLVGDREHWQDRGTTVVTVGPAVDGSGVEVTTSNEAADFAAALRERYPTMSFTVRQGSDVVPPVYTGSMPVYTGPPPYATK